MFRTVCIALLFMCSAESLFSQKRKPVIPDTTEYEDRKFFISKKNGLYGLGDSVNHWLDNTPTGDTIFHVQNYHFAVRGIDKLYTIYDESLKPIAEKVSGIKEFKEYILLKGPNGWTVFASVAEKNATYYDSISIHGNYTWLYKNGKQGLLTSGIQAQLIPAEYDKLGPFYDGVLLLNNGKLGWKGPFIIPVNYDHIYKERPDVMAAKNSAGTIYYSYATGVPLVAEPTDSIVFYDRYYKRVRGKQQSIFRIENNSLLAEINGEQIHPYSFENNYGESGYCIVGRDSVCALYKGGKQLTDFNYQNILHESSITPPFFRVVKDKHVGVIYENGDVQLTPAYTDVINRIGDYYIVRKGSRLGLALKGDSLLLPCEYQNITFCDDTYLYLSKDGTYFGLYNYITKKVISDYKYRDFWVDSLFIMADQGATSDVYYKDQPVFTDLYDAESNITTVKGYKNGKVYIGAVRKGAWESYEYEIPSYKIKTKKERKNYLQSTWLSDASDTYDYAFGKWGVFSFRTGSWQSTPLAHGGNKPNGVRMLDFPTDTAITWQGIAFHSTKKVSPIDIAWDRKSKFNWIDVQEYTYNTDYETNVSITVSPICYTEPGAGKCLENYKGPLINTGFIGNSNKSVLAEGGRVRVANYGQIGLSEFYSQLSACGNVHPASIKDYETIIDPSLYVSVSGGTEHVLHHTSQRKHISMQQSFEWTDKTDLSPLTFRVASKYGLLSDTGSYLLKPEYESISPINTNGSVFAAGVRSDTYRVYYPETNTYSREIPQLVSFKEPFLLIKADSVHMAVLDHRLDTFLLSTGVIRLLEDSSYTLRKNGITTLYKNRNILFSHTCDTTEKINEGHYLISGIKGHFIMSAKGDTIYQSKQHIRYVGLGNNYLLDSGGERKIFDLSDHVVFSFQKEPYLVTELKDLIIKEKESVVLLKKNATKQTRINGRFVRATKGYVISKTSKNRSVYTFSGAQLVSKVVKAKAINDRYFSYQQKKKFLLYDVNTGEKRSIEHLGVNITKEGLDYDGSDEEDDSTQVVETIEDLYSIVSYRGKYGLKKEDKLILPYNYFHIQKTGDVFLVQDRVDYKLYDYNTNTFITGETYTKVYPYKEYMYVLKDGRWSYIKP